MKRHHIISSIFAFFMVQYCGGAPCVEMKYEEEALLEKKAEGGDATAAAELAERYSRGEGCTTDYEKVYMWAKKAAETGDARGQRLLGSCYMLGVGGVEKDVKKAAELYRRAAEGGNVEAMESLAFCYSKGEGVPKDESLAVLWTKRAAEGGAVDAQYRLGIMYAQGHTDEPKDTTAARHWLKKAVAQGHEEAVTALVKLMFSEGGAEAQKELEDAAAKGDRQAKALLGALYLRGLQTGKATEGDVSFEIKKDIEKGVKFTREAAEEGDVYAMGNMGELYWVGLVVGRDPSEAIKWWKRAAAAGGKVNQTTLAIALMQSSQENEREEGLRWLEKSAATGNTEAQCMLGSFYLNGRNVKKDTQYGLSLIITAAKAENKGAQKMLVLLYYYGYDGMSPNYDEAREWAEIAVSDGDRGLQKLLGLMMVRAEGGPRDIKRGVELIKKSADQGEVEAQLLFGSFVYAGCGVEKNEDLGRAYLKKAADAGNEKARELYETSYERR